MTSYWKREIRSLGKNASNLVKSAHLDPTKPSREIWNPTPRAGWEDVKNPVH